MKTLKNLMLLIGLTAMMFSCNRYDQARFDLPDSSEQNPRAHSLITGGVFVVEPSGSDDTPAILQAFTDAKASGPGSVVQLLEGEYHLGLLEVYDFYGSLRGAGKDKTIITAIGGIDIDKTWARHLCVDLVKFVGGDVSLSHFTMQTPPGALSTGGPGTGHIYSLLNFSSFNAVYEPGNENRAINVVIDNVSFKGQLLDGGTSYIFHYNCALAVRTGMDFYNADDWHGDKVPRQNINFKITNCEFETFVYGIGLECIKNGRVIIGEKNNGNIFRNLDQCGGVWEFRDSEISIEGNTFNTIASGYGLDLNDWQWYPSLLKDEPPTRATLFNVQNNVFNIDHYNYGLYMRNWRHTKYPGDIPVAFLLRNNQFNMTDASYAIRSLQTQGMVIRNNKYSGYGNIGIYLSSYSVDGLALGNNISTAEFLKCAIYLVSSTKNWTIVGGNTKGNVINEGIDNIITGINVSASDIPLGQTISEKLPPIDHLMH
jgi:hypothetical protein